MRSSPGKLSRNRSFNLRGLGSIIRVADEARFVIDRSRDGQYHFFLRARNGEKLVTSETYTTKQCAENGIQAVKKVAPSAPVIDITDR